MYKRKMLNKKGVVITLDSIFAILATLTIITSVLFYMGQISKIPYNKQSLSRISQDSLTILEKDGTLKRSIETGTAAMIGSYLESLPKQICAEIYLKDSNKNMILNITRTGCIYPEESVVQRRVFIANNLTIYYARMESWFKSTLPGGTI